MRGLGLVARFVVHIFPEVERELGHWQQRLEAAGDPELRRQGLASIEKKRFHAQGGSIYALSVTASGAGATTRNLVAFIVAFQTISDYLDNLCDRAAPASGHPLDTAAFRQLHRAFTDALDPDSGAADYYRFYPCCDDGGYLPALVEQCRQSLRQLPSYDLVQGDLLRFAGLYSDLQTFKHTFRSQREGLLQNWFAVHAAAYPDLDWWEFAAATGSTLGIFALCAAATDPHLAPEAVSRLSSGYFPWISGLHILLDYFIDQAEDEAGGDLNFISYYPDPGRCRERLLLFLQRSLDRAAALPDPLFHTTVVRGLPAFYLSDPKVNDQGFEQTAGTLLSAGGRETLSMYRACRLLRWLGKL
ncbi:MAG: tetraprenyl-beta-curcumene synthase family protein [Thermacetogeniaceae bacterium]